MPSQYSNLPGINLELLDGNLQIDQPITGPVTLVIGRAVSGPSNFQYLVTDSNQAAAVYGSGSPLMEKLSEVKLGGSKNIILYRIGGSAAEISGIFGLDTLLGTREETVTAGGKYSVYIGPEPSNSAKACIIAFEGDKIVYSNVTGSEVDLGKFNIAGFDKDTSTFVSEYRVGTPSNPVLLSAVASSIKLEGQLNETGDGTTTEYDLAGGNNAEITSVTVDGNPTSAYTIGDGTGTGGVDQIIFDVAPAGAEAIVVDYGVDAVTAGSGAGEFDFDAGTRSGETITYVAGGDSMNATWKDIYELVDRAYSDLETTIATEIVVEKIILDAPNIADGSTDSDRLEYLFKEEEFGEVTYEWSTETVEYSASSGASTTNDPLLADLDLNGQPIITKRFEEVNFAHQLATWCHNITENERFVLGTIGTSTPAVVTNSAVARWLGTLPQTDVSGNIIANGTGLLGNKYMAGSTSQMDGFYLTDTGFPSGNAQYDSNGTIIDIGKYISVVAGAIQTPDLSSFGSTVRMTNGAGVYSGLLSTIVPGDSTTNALLPGISLPFTIKKTKLDELSQVGYVSFQAKSRGTVVVSGELATNINSDYDYVSTAIIIRDIARKIRTRLEPFIGKGLNQVTVAAAETAVEGIFQESVNDGAVVKYSFSLVQEQAVNGRGKLRIPCTVVPAFELREVDASVKLAYDI